MDFISDTVRISSLTTLDLLNNVLQDPEATWPSFMPLFDLAEESGYAHSFAHAVANRLIHTVFELYSLAMASLTSRHSAVPARRLELLNFVTQLYHRYREIYARFNAEFFDPEKVKMVWQLFPTEMQELKEKLLPLYSDPGVKPIFDRVFRLQHHPDSQLRRTSYQRGEAQSITDHYLDTWILQRYGEGT